MSTLRLLVCMAVLAAGLAVAGSSTAAMAQGGAQQTAAQRCFGHHKFGAQPVDVAKSADGQTVLAQVSWGYHDAIGCYLALDAEALDALRAAAASTTTRPDTDDTTGTDETAGALVFEGREVLAQQSVGTAGASVSHGTARVSVPAGALISPAVVAIHEPLGDVGGEVGGEIVSVNHRGPVKAPIMVQWDVSHLSGSQQQSLMLVRWDEQLEDWIPGNADHDIVTGVLTAEIQEWSFWTWLTSVFEPQAAAYRTISAGQNSACAIKTNGTAECWAGSIQLESPSGSFISISMGVGASGKRESHACGIRTDRSIICWGDNSFGQSDPPEGTFAAVSAGGGHSCAIRTDGTVICWGHNYAGKADPPAGSFTAISAGTNNVCAIRTNATAICWGHNRADVVSESGEAGEYTRTSAGNPRYLPKGTFSAISNGVLWYTCGIRTDGTLICWGSGNYNGELDVPSGQFVAVSSGQWHSCGIRADRTAACWGWNQNGAADSPEGAFASISAGVRFACGIKTDGTPICWPYNPWAGRDPQAADPPGTQPGTAVGAPWKIRGVKAAGRPGQLAVSWSPPGDGGSAIEEYEVSYWGSGEARYSHVVRSRVSSGFVGGLTTGETYGASVRAVNSVGAGPWSDPVWATLPVISAPRNLSLDAVSDDVTQMRGVHRLEIGWSPPRHDGGSPATGYVVEIEAPHGQSDSPKRTVELDKWSRSYLSDHLLPDVLYDVRVAARNDDGLGEWASSSIRTPGLLPAPTITLSSEIFPFGIVDDRDLRVDWTPINGAGGYEIDWQYIEIDTDELASNYERLQQSDGLSDAEQQDIHENIEELLQGEVVPARHIGGNSKPSADAAKAEVTCYVAPVSSSCRERVAGGIKGFQPDNPAYIIHSANKPYILQLRVRALADSAARNDRNFGDYGEWSPWIYLDAEWLGLACKAFDAYNTISDIRAWADRIGWGVMVVSVIAAPFTGGASVAAGTAAAKAAVVAMAKEFIRLILKKEAIKELVKRFLLEMVKTTVKDSVLRQVGYFFKCIGHGADLSDQEIYDFGMEAFKELKNQDPSLAHINLSLPNLADNLRKSILP